jgi:hypothetical protein
MGKKVKGGFYGKPPSLTDLDDGKLSWMVLEDTRAVLKGDSPALGVFA